MKEMKRRVKTIAVLLVAAATVAAPLATGSGGTAFKHPHPVVAHADEGDYNKLAVDLATATAFDDARNAVKADEGDAEERKKHEDAFFENLKSLTDGSNFGNVGLFIGPKGTSKSTDVWSVFQSKVSIDNSQIKAYDDRTKNGAFRKYKAFGGAVQKLNGRAQKTKGSSSSMQKGLDELSAAGTKLTNLGTTLLKEYNPAPLVLSFFNANELNTHPDNKLVALVNHNRDLRNMFGILGSPTRFGVSLSFLIMGIGAFLLLVTSVLMQLINGRTAGENIRKLMVKVVIGCVAVPLIAKGLDAGVNFLGESAEIQVNSPASNYVEQNLNLADWYACGFSLPSGTSLTIDKNGQFVLSPDDVRAINTFTYKKIWGTPTDKKMMEKMEEYYTQYKAFPMNVGFSEPITRTGSRRGRPWRTDKFYAALANFGSNESMATDGVDISNIGYFVSHLNMRSSGSGWTVSGSSNNYGISPIAATNLMRTSFTGSSMTVSSNSTMGAVVFDVDNGAGVGTSQMSSITRFLATFAMLMAAMKGLFTVFSAGFAGVLSGGAKSAMGSTTGFGQAIGGGIALVGGVLGISVIMTMSFTLLDQMYGVMQTLLSNTTGGTDLLEPFREVVSGVPIIGPLLGDAMKSIGRFILTILCALTLPKFGGIPVTLFCQYLAELPNRFAERAQQLENKFTGDFRGGAGRFGGSGMAGASALANQAVQQGKAQGLGMLAGAAAAGGALAGYGLNKAGKKLEEKYSEKDTTSSESMTTPESGVPDPVDEEGIPAVPETEGTAPETETDAVSPSDGNETANETSSHPETDSSGMTISGGNTSNETVEGGMQEETSETINDQEEGGSLAVENSEQSMSAEESMSDSSMSEQSMSAEQTSEQSLASEQSTLHDGTNTETSDTENTASASISSRSDTMVESGKASMNSTDGNTQASSSGVSAPGTSAQASPERRTSMSTGSADRQKLTQEQRHARNMRAIGKGLQAMGGHTTKGQAVAGVAAGLAHVAGSRVGAQNVTGRGVAATRNYRQRQNDIRQGLPPNYSQTQRRQNQKPNPAGGQGGRPNASRPDNGGRNPNLSPQNQRFTEYLAREAEMREQEAREAEHAARARRE